MNTLNQDNNHNIISPVDPGLAILWNSVCRTSSGCHGVLVSPNTIYFSPLSNVGGGEMVQFPDGSTHTVVDVFAAPSGALIARISTMSLLPFEQRYVNQSIPALTEGFLVAAGVGRGEPFAEGWRFGGPDTFKKRWHFSTVDVDTNLNNPHQAFYAQSTPAAATFTDLTAGGYVWVKSANFIWYFFGYVLNPNMLADYLTSRYPLPLLLGKITEDADFIQDVIDDNISIPPTYAVSIHTPSRNTQLNSPDVLVNGTFNLPSGEVYVVNAATNVTSRAATTGNTYSVTMQLNFGINILKATVIQSNGTQTSSLPSYIFRTEDNWPDPAAPRPPMTVEVRADILWKRQLYRIDKHITL